MEELLATLMADKKNWTYLLTMTRLLAPCEEHVEDIIHNAIVTILSSELPVPPSTNRLSRWLGQVIRWQISKDRRTYAQHMELMPTDSLTCFDDDWKYGHPTDNSSARWDDEIDVHSAFAALPTRIRLVVWERVVEGKEWSETTGAKQGYHRATLDRWYHKGIEQMRRYLTPPVALKDGPGKKEKGGC